MKPPTKRNATGKTRGRPPGGLARLADDFGEGHMERQLKRQMKALEREQVRAGTSETATFRIVMAERSKRGGRSIGDRALWLIDHEIKNRDRPAELKPSIENLAAVERWLRDIHASSYEAAMMPRPPKETKRNKKPIPYAGKAK